MSDEEQFDSLFYNVMQGARGIDNFFDKCFGFFRRKTDYFAAPDKAFQALQLSFQLNEKKYKEQKDKDDKKKKKTEEDKKKKLLEEELNRRSQAQNSGTKTTTTTTTNTSNNDNSVKSSVKAEPTVREITPEEFERNQKMEKEKAVMERLEQEKLEKERDNPTLNIDFKKDEHVEQKLNNTSEQKNDINRVFVVHDPTAPFETPPPNKACISPNHPCIFSKYGASVIKEIWTDEHGKTSIMPTKTHGGQMDRYHWGQPRVEENWITIFFDKDVRGKEVKVNADSNNLSVVVRGEEIIKREFSKPINVNIFKLT